MNFEKFVPFPVTYRRQCHPLSFLEFLPLSYRLQSGVPTGQQTSQAMGQDAPLDQSWHKLLHSPLERECINPHMPTAVGSSHGKCAS